ncbi:MAG: hypothetical protein Kow00108_12710 [Calditrichia bacterium]
MKLFKKAVKKLLHSDITISFYVPLLGFGCGVLGMILKKQEIKLGSIASNLLKALEYRGYDSTGAIIQNDKGDAVLKKDVGAPSVLVKSLGIEKMEGRLFCGQVRWATFGVVDKLNAQPHMVECKRYIYGAHNGNITNTAYLKDFLLQEGHDVKSDNDGEMLVHIVEHYFDQYLDGLSPKDAEQNENRIKGMRHAILKASNMVEGSYAAVIVDPKSEVLWGIKSGSSFYAGKGNFEGNAFMLVSSDLTALLRYTKNVVPLFENQFIECTADDYTVFALKDHTIQTKDKKQYTYQAGEKIDAPLQRSKLRVEDTALNPPYKYYMEQEIFSTVKSSQKLIDFFNGGSQLSQSIIKMMQKEKALEQLEQTYLDMVRLPFEKQKETFSSLMELQSVKHIRKGILKEYPELLEMLKKPEHAEREFSSKYASIFLDLKDEAEHLSELDRTILAKVLDSSAFHREYRKFNTFLEKFVEVITDAWERHSNIYTIACGTSYNASKTAALFFNDISNIEIIPILPGNFRGQYSHTLRDGDVLIGISQSGETKDLIDIFNDVIRSGKKIHRIMIVNNENSTLAQEKSDFYLPIKCGPEIAVPATKSYMNQVILFYYLSLLVAERCNHQLNEEQRELLQRRKDSLQTIPELLSQTLKVVDGKLDEMAEKLYLEPSIHILATKISSVAEEGALKIRETVLNHTQGIEGSEFKHGPNTILGKNTILGIHDAERMVKKHSEMIIQALKRCREEAIPYGEARRLIEDISDFVFQKMEPFNLSPKAMAIFREITDQFSIMDELEKNYPLIFITGPDERDIKLTISQINTHKIRGANVFVIAEPNEELYKNISSVPKGIQDYTFSYVELPKTDDTLMTTFSGMIALQLLALKMSIKKMKHLNKLHIPLHGVHPDVPKNVSKSITVD